MLQVAKGELGSPTGESPVPAWTANAAAPGSADYFTNRTRTLLQKIKTESAKWKAQVAKVNKS